MKYTYKKAFSIIEILVGIFIFSLGLVSIYAVILSTIRINDYNSNYIVATNLAKEQIELVKNIRDSNYMLLKPYNLKNPDGINFDDVDKFEIGHYYKIDNNFGNNFPIFLDDISSGFKQGKENLTSSSMQSYRLCLDINNIYTYDCSGDNKKTEYYRFFYIDNLQDNNGIINDTFRLTSKVIWYKRGYHEFEIKTVVADWKRL